MKEPGFPAHALRVKTYKELEEVVQGFAQGCLNFLLLLGPPGVGKSCVVRTAVGEAADYVSGNATPFGVYLASYQHRGRPLILDDVDSLYRDRQGVRLLKALCQSDREKSLSWLSDARSLAARGVPNQFTTTSTVTVIGNDWSPANPDVLALQDRAHCVVFEPSALAVHWHAARFFWDQTIFDFIGEHLHLAQPHSLRTYVLAWEAKSAGLDWRRSVLSRLVTGNLLVVAGLKADPNFESEEQRARTFIAGGHGCRATYFKLAKQFRNSEPAPSIPVCGSPPPPPPPVQQHYLDLIRRRFGQLGSG